MKKVGFITLLSVAVLGVFLGIRLLSPFSTSTAHAASKATTHTLTSPVSGTISNGDTFTGTLTVQKFVSQAGQLLAVGTITGTVQQPSTAATKAAAAPAAVTVPVAIPVTSAAPGLVCNVLNLVLGPLHLNLLGLVVDLNQVILNITAQPGALLGNLLCSLAGLLNGGTPLAGLTGLLNQILGAL